MLPSREEDLYVAWRPPFPEPRFDVNSTALVVVDMQHRCAHTNHEMCQSVRDAGFGDQLEWYLDRLTLIVPNIRRLQDAFRRAGMEVIHIRIQSMTNDGRDRSGSHKKLGHEATPGSKGAAFLEELRPVGDELVFNKTVGSPFSGTNIEYVLRNMGIENLIVAGVVTTGCVLTTVTDAADRGFHVGLVEDGSAALVSEMHWSAVRIMRDVYAKILGTGEVMDRISSM